MTAKTQPPDLARVAAIIGQPTRTAMLDALMGGRWLTATELGRRAGVAPATASSHLSQLVDAGLVARRCSGRRRYHAIANADVAAALEALGRIATPDSGPPADPLRFARTCYDHVAGSLGVLLTDTLVARRIVAPGSMGLPEAGARWLAGLGVDVDEVTRRRRPLVRFCLDWSERRDHLAGAIGAALAELMLERRWLVRMEGTRALRLTVRGQDGLYKALDLDIAAH
jgi:DNA-binding transcriptional ArsR family regulator